MEELKMLIEMVAHLPQLALWVVIAFWCYKVICIGTIYGVIRLAIVKTHNWLTTPERKIVQFEERLRDLGLAHPERLIEQIMRIRHQGDGTKNYGHISITDIQWLTDAIDDKITKEQAIKTEKESTTKLQRN